MTQVKSDGVLVLGWRPVMFISMALTVATTFVATIAVDNLTITNYPTPDETVSHTFPTSRDAQYDAVPPSGQSSPDIASTARLTNVTSLHQQLVESQAGTGNEIVTLTTQREVTSHPGIEMTKDVSGVIQNTTDMHTSMTSLNVSRCKVKESCRQTSTAKNLSAAQV